MERRNRYQQDINRARPWFKTRDGHKLSSRLIQPADAPLLLDLFERLSSETRRRRFHIAVDHVSEELKRQTALELAHVDNRTQGGAVLALDKDEQGQPHIVGVARLARPAGQPDHPEAEAAIVVRDDFQGRGVGTELLRRMVLLAKQMQVKTIIAAIEADNLAAIKLFRALGLPTQTHTSHGEMEMRITAP
jgi:acetyltransferase